VTVINQAMARRYWPNENPIGKQLLIPSQRVPATIVGVVADMKHSSLREVPGPEMFEPYTQDVWPSIALMEVVIRTQAPPDTVIGAAREAIHQIDPGLPLAKISTMEAIKNNSMAGERFSMLLVCFFGAIALLLAAVGIYGLISYSVGQQTREIGIRIALGAQREHIFGMIIRRGLWLSALGILLGVIAALGVSRFLASFLYEVHAADPVIFASVSAFLAVVSLGACFIPARRASAIDPMEALRVE